MVRVFNHWFPSNTVLHVVLDLILLVISVVLAVSWLSRGGAMEIRSAIPYALLFAVTMMALNSWLGFYQRGSSRTVAQTWGRVVMSLHLAVPVAYCVFAVLPKSAVTHEALQLAALVGLCGLVVLRGYATHAGLGPMLVRRVLVFGTGPEAATVERFLAKRAPEIEIVGFYRTANDEEVHVSSDRIHTASRPLPDVVRSLKADEVIVAVRERRGGVMPLAELLDCKLAGINVLDLASFYERSLGQVRLDSLRASWLIFGDGFRQGLIRTAVKRLFDIVAATILLVVSLPAMLATALLIVIESGFPIFYRQERVGLEGRLFKVIKFRSMRTDAEKDGKPRWAASNDDRVTVVGRAIRKLRIDELPQLFNVLKGDMSLVGPRPERPYFVDQLTREIPFYAARHSVKPGVTGWAQVRYHYGASVEDAAEKLQYDLYYVKNHSLFLDTVVLFETVGVVLTGAGAH